MVCVLPLQLRCGESSDGKLYCASWSLSSSPLSTWDCAEIQKELHCMTLHRFDRSSNTMPHIPESGPMVDASGRFLSKKSGVLGMN